MLDLKYTGKIKKDLKLCQKRGLDLRLLEKVIDTLRIPEPLSARNREHDLRGEYTGFKECHIAPDWLLIYRYNNGYLELIRTGTHSDLFKK